jgi:hypothetical protein
MPGRKVERRPTEGATRERESVFLADPAVSRLFEEQDTDHDGDHRNDDRIPAAIVVFGNKDPAPYRHL